MRVLFLGTSCAEPTAENGFTSFLLEVGGALVLVDASGNPVQSILRAGLDPVALDLVVLTHHHADHLAGYPSLVQTLSCLGRRHELPVLCGAATRAKVRGLHSLLDLDPPHCTFPVRLYSGWVTAAFEVELLAGLHSVPTDMVRVRSGESRLLYTSDTRYDPGAGEAARGCRTLIHEATFSRTHPDEPGQEWHSSAWQAGLSAAAAGVERLLLCHICWHKHVSPAAIVEEARAAFKGEVVLPQPFTWYPV